MRTDPGIELGPSLAEKSGFSAHNKPSVFGGIPNEDIFGPGPNPPRKDDGMCKSRALSMDVTKRQRRSISLLMQV